MSTWREERAKRTLDAAEAASDFREHLQYLMLPKEPITAEAQTELVANATAIKQHARAIHEHLGSLGIQQGPVVEQTQAVLDAASALQQTLATEHLEHPAPQVTLTKL